MSVGHHDCLKCGTLVYRDRLCEPHWNQAQILAGSVEDISHGNTAELLEATGLTHETYREDGEWKVWIESEDHAALFFNSVQAISLNTGRPEHVCQAAAAFAMAVGVGAIDPSELIREIAPEVLADVLAILEEFPLDHELWGSQPGHGLVNGIVRPAGPLNFTP